MARSGVLLLLPLIVACTASANHVAPAGTAAAAGAELRAAADGPPSLEAAAAAGRKLAASLSVTKIEPNEGSKLGRTRITITGTGFSTNFIDGGNKVTIGRLLNGEWVGGDCEVLEGACTVECGSDTKIFCDTPAWDPAHGVGRGTGWVRDQDSFRLNIYTDCAKGLTGCAKTLQWSERGGFFYQRDQLTPTVRSIHPRYIHAGAVVRMAGSNWGEYIRAYRHGVYIGRGRPPMAGNIVTQEAGSAEKTSTQALCRPEDLNLAANPSTGEVDMASEPVLMETRTPAPIAKDRFRCRVGDFGAGSYYINVVHTKGLSVTDASLAKGEQRDHLGRPYLLQYYPVVSSVSPESGSVAGGLQVVVRGGGFSMLEANNTVTIGQLPCRVTYATLEELRCVAGDEAAATEVARAGAASGAAQAARRRLAAETAARATTLALPETAAAATGDWRVMSNAGAGGGAFLADMNAGKGERWLAFAPAIAATAWYRVSVVVPPMEAGCLPRAATMTVAVTHNGPGASRTEAVTVRTDAAARSETGRAFVGEFRFRAQAAGAGAEVVVDTAGTSGCVAVDGVHLEPVAPASTERRGCRDALAANFDRLATTDDGSCLFVGGRGIHLERLEQRCARMSTLTAPSGLVSDGRFPVHVTEAFGTACEWLIEPPGFGVTWDQIHVRVVDFDLENCHVSAGVEEKPPCHNVEVIDAVIDNRLARFGGCRGAAFHNSLAHDAQEFGDLRAVGGTVGDVCYEDVPYAGAGYVRNMTDGALPDRVVTVRGERMKIKYNAGPGGAGGARGFVLQYWTTKIAAGIAPAPAPAVASLRPTNAALGAGGECSAAMQTPNTKRAGAGLLWVPATGYVKGLGYAKYTPADCCSLCRRTASCRAWDFVPARAVPQSNPCRLFYSEGTLAESAVTFNGASVSGLMPLPAPLASQAAATPAGRALHQLPALIDAARAAKSPTFFDGIDLAETPDDNTAQSLRWRAFFVPPVAGRFRFNVALKDHGALWASLDSADPLHAVRLAQGTPGTAAPVQQATREFSCGAGEARYVELSALLDDRYSGEGSSLLTLTVWPAAGGGGASFNTSVTNALSAGWFRTVESRVQVAVTTNGLAAACQEGGVGARASCGFTYKTDRTPTVTALSPRSGAAGTALLTVTGTNFEAGEAKNTVSLGGVGCAVRSATATQIVCLVSRGTGGGRRAVRVGTPAGEAQHPADGKVVFDVSVGIAAVAPAAGSRAGGTRLTITGAGFDPFGPNNYVKVGGRRCEPVVIKNHECRSRIGSPGLPCNAPRAYAYAPLEARSYAEWIDFSNATHIECVLGSGGGASASAAEAAELVMVAVADPASVGLTAEQELAAAKAAGCTRMDEACWSRASVGGSRGAVDAFGFPTFASAVQAGAFTPIEAATPVVSSVSTSTGGAGSVLTITGSGFTPAFPVADRGWYKTQAGFFEQRADHAVTIGGAACVTTPGGLAWDRITCVVSANAAGVDHAVEVSIYGKGAARLPSPAPTFRYGLMVDSVAPASGAVGGGTLITITGSGFATSVDFGAGRKSTATARVTIGGSVCHVTSVTSTAVTCITSAAPAPAVHTAQLAISWMGMRVDAQCRGGSGSCAFGYVAGRSTYCESLRVDGGSSSSELVGAQGSVLAIGYNAATSYMPAAAAEAVRTVQVQLVRFGASDGPTGVVAGSCAVTAVAAGVITCTVGAVAPGTYRTRVMVAGHCAWQGQGGEPTLVLRPLVSGMSATRGGTNGGQVLTLTGQSLVHPTEPASATTVAIGGIDCPVVSASAGAVSCTVQGVAAPANLQGVVVTVAGTSSACRLGGGCSYSQAASDSAAISAISPSSGQGGAVLTISGTRFAASGNTVTIGGSACVISAQSATKIVCAVPQRTGGTFDVQLRSPTVGLATPKPFTFDVGITDVQPRAGSMYGGTLVTITGFGFATDADATAGVAANDARFGAPRTALAGVAAAWDLSIVSQTHHQIVARTGISYGCRGAAGTDEREPGTASALRMDIVQPSSAGNKRVAGLASGLSFAYAAASTPDVERSTPAVGSGGTLVTITGTGFSASATGNTVTIAGTPCAIVTAAANKITCAAGSRPATGSSSDVLVLVQGKGYAGCSGCPGAPKALPQFRYALTVSAVQPSKGSIGGGQLVQVSGSGFGRSAAAAVVNVGAAPCVVQSSNDVAIVCRTGAAGAGAAAAGATVDVEVAGNVDFDFALEVTAQGRKDGAPKDPLERSHIAILRGPAGIATYRAKFDVQKDWYERAGWRKLSKLSADDEQQRKLAGYFAGGSVSATRFDPATGDVNVTLSVGSFYTEGDVAQLVRFVTNTTAAHMLVLQTFYTTRYHSVRSAPLWSLLQAHCGGSSLVPDSRGTTDDFGSSINSRPWAFVGRCGASLPKGWARARGYEQLGTEQQGFARVLMKIGAHFTFPDTTNPATLTRAYTYDPALTPRVHSISRLNGTTAGGTVVELTGTNLGLALGNAAPGNTAQHATVTLAGKACAMVASEIGFYEGKSLCAWDGVRCDGLGVNAAGTVARCLSNAHAYLRGGAVVLHVPGKGTAVQPASIAYDYIDQWSAKTTWGGSDPPAAGDFAAISAGQIVVLDVSPPPLALLTIQGKLVVADAKDLSLTAAYIIINKGTLEAGTEWRPHQHKLTITLTGNRLSPEVPTFGAKCLGVRHGILDLHGRPASSWTRLAKTARQGDSHLDLLEAPQGWRRGDKIIITSTEYDQEEAEELEVFLVAGTRVQVTQPLRFTHYGDGWDQFGRRMDHYRAEVGLLSRSIVIQGDEETKKEQFGAQVVMSNGRDTGVANDLEARLSNVETRLGGQGLKLGKYPIHFHMVGKVSSSFVKNCSIHHSFNRALAIHGTHHLRVQANVVFETRGHAVFIEDGARRCTTSLRTTLYYKQLYWYA